MKVLSDVVCFEGRQIQFSHVSSCLNCEMTASIFLPPVIEHKTVPVLYWLSGLTCSDQNFVTKAGAQRKAAELGIAIVCPDTSPRGDDVPDDPEGAWDFGLGAGFYVNATQQPWALNYQMKDYVSSELPELVGAHFKVDNHRKSISGHSMGGHGALTIGLSNTDEYRSISAFSPIVSPMNCAWGEKALSNYIGDDKEAWANYDSCELVKSASKHLPILLDQGTADSFLKDQLKTHLIEHAAEQASYPLQIRYQEGYDHSYFFIASFIEDHLAFHRQYLID